MQAQRRQASPERWQKAAQRAVDEGVQVRQLADSGAWIATSGTRAGVAYTMEVVAGVARGCSCPAGEQGDPVCKHRARFYLDRGTLALDGREPERPCERCGGAGVFGVRREGAAVAWRVCGLCKAAIGETGAQLRARTERAAVRLLPAADLPRLDPETAKHVYA